MPAESEEPDKTPADATAVPASIPRWIIWLILTCILAFSAFVRIRLIDFPLERDEGEYAYAGQLMLQGIPPYKLAYNMKLPGTYAAYALIMAVFGQTIRGIHIGLILVNSVTTLLVYFLGRKLFGQICGVVAANCFALLSLSQTVYGLAAHATHFVTLFAVAGTLALLKVAERERTMTIFFCGLLFGMAFLMKQAGVMFGLFAGIFLLWKKVREPPANGHSTFWTLAVFSAGASLPFVLTCVVLAVAGVFHKFWFWTFVYAQNYVSLRTTLEGWESLRSTCLPLFYAAPFIWGLALLGIAMAILTVEKRRSAFFVIAFSVFSFATTCPGLYFREHYFITILPAAALCAGAGMQILGEQTWRFKNRTKGLLVIGLFLGSLGHTVFHHRSLLFSYTPNEAARALYGHNPFPESIEVARYIREHSPPQSRIAVLGSEPEIYFYSGRHSATGYIYTYGLMEPHKYALAMQREMISEIEVARPEFIIFANISTSWLIEQNAQHVIFNWFERYGPTHYRVVGTVDILPGQTIYRWDRDAVTELPRSNLVVEIFKRSDLF